MVPGNRVCRGYVCMRTSFNALLCRCPSEASDSSLTPAKRVLQLEYLPLYSLLGFGARPWAGCSPPFPSPWSSRTSLEKLTKCLANTHILGMAKARVVLSKCSGRKAACSWSVRSLCMLLWRMCDFRMSGCSTPCIACRNSVTIARTFWQPKVSLKHHLWSWVVVA